MAWNRMPPISFIESSCESFFFSPVLVRMTVLAPLAVLVAAGFVFVKSARVWTERRPAAGAAVGAMRGATASIDVGNVPLTHRTS